MLKSDIATSISLVVNELVQNSFEHAFKTSLEGNIEVLIKKRDSNACITVKDNGMGFNPDEVNKNSLGLVIVRSVIIEKLNGNINIDSTKDGTKVVLNFWF